MKIIVQNNAGHEYICIEDASAAQICAYTHSQVIVIGTPAKGDDILLPITKIEMYHDEQVLSIVISDWT